jgi:predicted acylesterase/phospholipase RssA
MTDHISGGSKFVGTRGWENTVKNAEKQAFKSGGVSTPQWRDARDSFAAFFSSKLAKLVTDLRLGPMEEDNLRTAANSNMREILKHFNRAEVKTTKELSAAVLKANADALKTLVDLRKQYATPETAPQVIPYFDKTTGKAGLTIIKPSPQLENIVLRGGGGKGIGNIPSLKALEESGMISDVKQVVGTSAGALTAIFMAIGMKAEDLEALDAKTNKDALQKKPANWEIEYPQVKLSGGGKHAGGVLETLDKMSATFVQDYLKSDGVEQRLDSLYDNKVITGEQRARLADLKDADMNRVDRSKLMITFRDLDLLNKVDPGKFKSLTLTGWNTTDRQIQYFNLKETPDLPIAIAGRASMAIPIIFKSIEIDIKGQPKQFVDGGVGSNMPGGFIFDDLEKKLANPGSEKESLEAEIAEMRAKTMLMTYDESGKAHKKMHGASESPAFSASRWVKSRATGENLTKVSTEDMRQIRNAGPNTFVVFHGKLDTEDLKPTAEEKEHAMLTARMHALEQVEPRQNQATYGSCTSAEDAAKSLTSEESKLILDQGPPEMPDFDPTGLSNEKRDAALNAELKAYELHLEFYTAVSNLDLKEG